MSPLIGNLLDAQNCFRILPRQNELPFGVLAELQVSKGWMKLRDPKPVTASKRLSEIWEKAFSGTDHIDEFHRKAFLLLLEHLVSKGLQADADGKYATLAARALRIETLTSDELEKRQIGLAERRLRLPVSTIESVLFEPRETVENILIEAGVTDLTELGALSSSLVFYPLGAEMSGRLVDLAAFLSQSFTVKIGRGTEIKGEKLATPRIFVPVDFARDFLLQPQSSRRVGCNEIDFIVREDGLYITFMRDGSNLTQVTRRGQFR